MQMTSIKTNSSNRTNERGIKVYKATFIQILEKNLEIGSHQYL